MNVSIHSDGPDPSTPSFTSVSPTGMAESNCIYRAHTNYANVVGTLLLDMFLLCVHQILQ